MRTMRGHGVHSPYAFRFITSVIARPGHYYADPEVCHLASGPGSAIGVRRLMLLFRLVCEFCPDAVWAASLHDAERRTIHLADSRVRFLKPRPLPAGCGRVMAVADTPAALPDGFACAIVRDLGDGGLEELSRRVGHGMIFHDGQMAVALCRPDVEIKTYKVRF